MSDNKRLPLVGAATDPRFVKQRTNASLDRFEGVVRPYTQADVSRLQGRTKVEHTLAKLGAIRLWSLMNASGHVKALGACTGNQAVQQVKAGLSAVYCSGWQVAADANLNGETYPDQSLYAANSVPTLVERINNALLRAEQIEHVDGFKQGDRYRHWMAPIVADAEAGFGGPLNVYELMKSMIRAGAAGVHFEDQLSSAKKCGHMGGKVLVPTSEFIKTLIAARLAADVLEVPTVIIARTDALSAKLITSDIDEHDRQFIAAGARTAEGFHRLVGDDMARTIARGLAYAPYADVLWFETSDPNAAEAQQFADAMHERFPGKKLAYNCSPSFAWSKKLTSEQIASFQDRLGEMGYTFQFVTLAGYHTNAMAMYDLARQYVVTGMSAYAAVQEHEFSMEGHGYTAVKHQHEAGTGVFDLISSVISGGTSSTLALKGSTEEAQFSEHRSQEVVVSSHEEGDSQTAAEQSTEAGADAAAEPDQR